MTRLILNGNFSAVAQGVLPPIEDALFYLRFGGTEEASLRNLMDRSLLTEVGAIVVQPTYVTLNGATGHINTGVLETSQNGTIFCIARAPAATGTVYLHSAQGGGTSPGLSLELTTTSVQSASTYADTGTARQAVPLAIPDRIAWRLYADVAEQGVGLRVFDETRDLTAALAKTTARTLNAATTMRIGARSTASTGGDVDIHQYMYVPRAVTGAEYDDTVAFMKDYALSQGITV